MVFQSNHEALTVKFKELEKENIRLREQVEMLNLKLKSSRSSWKILMKEFSSSKVGSKSGTCTLLESEFIHK